MLERYHSEGGQTLAQMLELLDAGWRRGGFGESERELDLRTKARVALTRYHERLQEEDCQPVWFERPFSFRLGPHHLRGRVDRVDRLSERRGGAYELIDYKTSRPKTASQLKDDVQLSLYALAARKDWQLDSSRQAYYYVLDDRKVPVPGRRESAEAVKDMVLEVGEGILAQEFEPTPSRAACSICDYRIVCPAAERLAATCLSSPRWRRKRWNSRASMSPEGTSSGALSCSLSAACSSRSTNAWMSGSLCTASPTWRS